MKRIFSNGPLKDYVVNPFRRMVEASSQIWAAAPFVTLTEDLLDATKKGKTVQLLVGLNASTDPKALAQLHGQVNCSIRYFTHKFHAKIYIFDKEALLGSSNLTHAGFTINREATICVDGSEDLDELRSLFDELWESAQVLTTEKLKNFTIAHRQNSTARKYLDDKIADAVGRAEPTSSIVGSGTKTKERVFLEDLRREVYEQYRPAFWEVTAVLVANGLRRPELADIGASNETNRFLNWVRKSYAPGEEAWRSARRREEDERRELILMYGGEWAKTDSHKIPGDYLDWLETVQLSFGSREVIEGSSKEDLIQGLMCVHAFNEQYRFTSGGAPNLPAAFWAANGQDVQKVKKTLLYLLYGKGDFIERLYDILNVADYKLALFGRFCALELFGTIKPEECPPMNGRMAKALCFLGYPVKGN